MQSENQICARQRLHVLDDFLVTLAFSDELIAPVRERMRPHRRDLQAAARSQLRQFRAQRSDVIARTTNGLANFGAQLNDRLAHLRFDLLFERDFSAFENFVNMRTQLARLGVDDGELLFDSQSERMVLHARVAASKCPSKTMHCHPERNRGIPLRKLNGQISGFFDSDLASLRMTRYASSPNERRVTAACTNLPQLRL